MREIDLALVRLKKQANDELEWSPHDNDTKDFVSALKVGMVALEVMNWINEQGIFTMGGEKQNSFAIECIKKFRDKLQII